MSLRKLTNREAFEEFFSPKLEWPRINLFVRLSSYPPVEKEKITIYEYIEALRQSAVFTIRSISERKNRFSETNEYGDPIYTNGPNIEFARKIEQSRKANSAAFELLRAYKDMVTEDRSVFTSVEKVRVPKALKALKEFIYDRGEMILKVKPVQLTEENITKLWRRPKVIKRAQELAQEAGLNTDYVESSDSLYKEIMRMAEEEIGESGPTDAEREKIIGQLIRAHDNTVKQQKIITVVTKAIKQFEHDANFNPGPGRHRGDEDDKKST